MISRDKYYIEELFLSKTLKFSFDLRLLSTLLYFLLKGLYVGVDSF